MANKVTQKIADFFPTISAMFRKRTQFLATPDQPDVAGFDGVDRRPFRGLPLFRWTEEDHVIASAMASLYTTAVTTRRSMLTEMDRLKSFYLTHALVQAVIEDALTPTYDTSEILQIHSQNPQIDKELEILQGLYSFDQIVNDMAPDLLLYGEYTFRLICVEGQGVADIMDDVDPTKLIGMYNQGFPQCFIQQTDRDIEVFPPYAFANFVFGRDRLRIKLSNEMHYTTGDYVDAFGNNYPLFARVGRPLLYGVIYKMKELMVLEQLIPSSQLNRVLTSNLLTLQVPPSMTPEQAFEATRRYENMINSKMGINRESGDVSVTDILTAAGKVRVLPQIGEKGQLTNIQEVRENRTLDDLLHSVQDVRSVICASMGLPPEILFGGREAGAKSDFLKRYARYLRKLKFLQASIARGVTQICLAHLINRGIQVRPEDILVNFRNELPNTDELEKLEFSDGVVQLVSGIDTVVQQMNQQAGGLLVDPQKYHEFLYKIFDLIGRDSNFITSPEQFDHALLQQQWQQRYDQSNGVSDEEDEIEKNVHGKE